MFTISDLARLAEIDRRTMQLWCDNDVLQPEPLQAGRKRALYPFRELEIARLLRIFSRFAMPTLIIKFYAQVFRDRLLDPSSWGALEADTLGPLLESARSNKPAFLGVQLKFPDQGQHFEAMLYPSVSAGEIALEQNPDRPVLTISLTEALAPVAKYRHAKRRPATWAVDYPPAAEDRGSERN